jgi:hypothetical protein
MLQTEKFTGEPHLKAEPIDADMHGPAYLTRPPSEKGEAEKPVYALRDER